MQKLLQEDLWIDQPVKLWISLNINDSFYGLPTFSRCIFLTKMHPKVWRGDAKSKESLKGQFTLIICFVVWFISIFHCALWLMQMFFSLCLEEEKRFMNWDLVKAKRRPNDCHLKMTYNFSIHAPHIRHGINLCTQDEMQIKTTF